MIYITGDCHSRFKKFSTNGFPIQKEMTKEDFMIICGDFGGVWNYEEESKEEKYWLDWLNDKNFTVLFVDGNHENFTRLYSYPVEEWHGGKVHKIRDSVLHLMRGEIFDIEGKKFFTFGGAKSHDIQDGILNIDEKEKISNFNKQNKLFRVRDYSWWDLELPTKEEMENGLNNLKKVDYKVDYIISHCCPTNIQNIVGAGLFKKDYLTDYLQKIADKCEYKKWFFGHYHENREINPKFTVLYYNIIPLDYKSVFSDNKNESYPKYTTGNRVKFKFKDEVKEGVITIVDQNGAFLYPNTVCYDIFSGNPKVLYKHVRQEEVVGIIED